MTGATCTICAYNSNSSEHIIVTHTHTHTELPLVAQRSVKMCAIDVQLHHML
jgi:hypothetical protein